MHNKKSNKGNWSSKFISKKDSLFKWSEDLSTEDRAQELREMVASDMKARGLSNQPNPVAPGSMMGDMMAGKDPRGTRDQFWKKRGIM